MEVVIYTRVSTEEQRENGFSLQDQARKLKDYCTKHGKTILGHYQDDRSAKDFNRPEFQRMLADIRSKTIRPKQLLCVRVDRFSRNVAETVAMTQTLNKLGVNVAFLENDYDLEVPENYLPYMINATLAQVDNMRRGLNTKAGMRQAVRQGRWVWKAPVGYVNDQVAKTVIKGPVASLVKRAFLEVANGMKSPDAIRIELNKQGFKCSKQNFLNMLRNPFFMGKILLKAWRNEPEELVNGIHEPLIDSETFERVQDVLKGRSRKQSNPSKLKVLFPLRGHLLCKECGHKLTASSSKGRSKKYHYYHCQSCNSERFHAEEANQVFEQYLGTIQVNKEIADLYSQVLQDVFEQNEGSKEARVKEIEGRINTCLDKLRALDDKFLSGIIPDEDYNRMGTALKADINRLQEEKDKAAMSETNLDRHFKYGISLLSHLPYYYTNAPIELKHKLIGSIFPGNLIFENNNYRTAGAGSLLSLICSNSSTYKGAGNKKAILSDGLSTLAPPAGLERSSSVICYL